MLKKSFCSFRDLSAQRRTPSAILNEITLPVSQSAILNTVKSDSAIPLPFFNNPVPL